jgi:hypothetical protein
MTTWQTVTGRSNQKLGRMRRTRKGRWVVEGRTGSFVSPLDAMDFLLRREENMQYQVKTALSHEYWTGKAWVKDRNQGKLYKTKGKAENVAHELNKTKNSGSQSWNRVLVADWVEDNWGRN